MREVSTLTQKNIYADTAYSPKLTCESTGGLRFYNTKTRQMFHVRCNTYACNMCGKTKIYKLQTALSAYFAQFDFIRLWTFTLSSDIGLSKVEHFKTMQKCWNVFLKELRRTKSISAEELSRTEIGCNPKKCNSINLSNLQRSVQFVKVLEMHKSGFIHYHAMFTEFIPRRAVDYLWRRACFKVTGISGYLANAHVTGSKQNSNKSAEYVLKQARASAFKVGKYVSKSFTLIGARVRRWSRSEKCALFPKLAKGSGDFILLKYHSYHTFIYLASSQVIEQVPELHFKSLWDTLFPATQSFLFEDFNKYPQIPLLSAEAFSAFGEL